MNRISIMMCAMLATGAAFARDSYVGAWAFAEESDKPVLVITNKTAWLLRDGAWHPGMSEGTSFRPIGDAAERIMRVREYKNEITLKDVWRVGDREDVRSSKKIVSASMPNLTVDVKKYIGFWKPVKGYDWRGREMTTEKKNEFVLKLREESEGQTPQTP